MRNAVALVFAFGFTVAACGSGNEASTTVLDVAADNPQFTKLTAAIEKAGLATTLRGAGPFTVFAPTDAAFASLAAAGVDAGALDAATLGAVLQSHVVAGKKTAADVASASTIATLNGNVTVRKLDDGNSYLNGVARIVQTDIQANNGVVHVIDGVLLPASVAGTLNLAQVTTAYASFSTLLGLVKQAGLASTLADTSKTFTVFAPTNTAFAALASVPNGQALTDTLLYHVLPLKADSTIAVSVAAMPSPNNTVQTALSGKAITLGGSASAGLKINGSANIIYTDIPASNGVIHLIDKVLTPP